MTALEELITSGQLVVLMSIFVFLELTFVIVYWMRTRRGIAPLPMLLNVGSGAALMGAIWCALVSDMPWLLLPCLGLSLAFHVADLGLRWQH
jgi:hypothetical protein